MTENDEKILRNGDSNQGEELIAKHKKSVVKNK